MGINKRYVEKFEKAYTGIPEIISPIEFLPTSPYYHMEEWREVLPLFVPGVLPQTYWVSSYGRVYSNLRSPKYPNGGIMVHSINPKGYHQINLQSTEGKKIGIKIAKLVMLHFRFVPGCHLMEVDHIDSNKDNNCLWNYEWVNPQENTHRAIRNQQRTISCHVGYINEDNVLLSDQQARELFYKALSSYTYTDLAQEYSVSVQYISYLVTGSIRPYIRKEYDEYRKTLE